MNPREEPARGRRPGGGTAGRRRAADEHGGPRRLLSRVGGPGRSPGSGGARRKRRVGGPTRAAATGLLATAVLSLAPPAFGTATAQDGTGAEGGGGDVQVRDLEYRVRDLEYRWRAPDNSERVEQAAEQTTVTFAADVLFEYDRADLTPEAKQRLEELAGELADLGARTITVAGHTDDHGDPAYNQDLSVRRAQAVQAALDTQFADGFEFEVAGYGETRPVAPNQHEDGSDDPEGRALNRRVEIGYPTD